MKTHADNMTDFLNLIVDSTKNASTHRRLEQDANQLTQAILHEHQKNMLAASKNSRSEAVIFSYALGTQYRAAPVYDLLFPNKYLLKQFECFHIQPIFIRVQTFFQPFDVFHRVYQLTTKGSTVTMKEVDFQQHDVHIFTNTGNINMLKGEYIIDGDYSDDEIVDTCDDAQLGEDIQQVGIQYVASIVVSWESHLNIV